MISVASAVVASAASPALGHMGLLHPLEGMGTFGTDWWYVVGAAVFFIATATLLVRAGDDPGRVRDRTLRRGASGAAKLTGLPHWAAAMSAVLLGFLPVVVMGFFWDVAWHTDIGRDEYLLSPPHVLLALGVGPGFAIAAVVGIMIATYTKADVAWSWRTYRIPTSAAFLLAATALGSVGWVVDELWHMMYGLDITMWSPTHMGMIGSAFLLGAALWLLIGEARPHTDLTLAGKVVLAIMAGGALEAFSSVQLEYDLGVPQWQMLFQPILIVLAAGLALPAARLLLGRGGAFMAVGVFLGLRMVLAVTVDQVWHFTAPRFPLYLAAALAVELAFHLTRDTRTRIVTAGLGIASLGTAGEWAWSYVDSGYFGLTHAWQVSMFPSVLWVMPVGIAATAIGVGLGQVSSGRPLALSRRHVGVALAVLAVGLAWPSPRIAPPDPVTVTTSPAGPGMVDVRVIPAEAGAYDGAERFEVFAWQGGNDPSQTGGSGVVNTPLVRLDDGSYASSSPVPVRGSWKTMVLLNRGSAFGAFPVFLPVDEEYGLREVPVVERRDGAFEPAQAVMMRESHGEGGPWVAILAYLVLAAGLGGQLVLLVQGSVAIDARRRERLEEEGQPATGRSVSA
jgi:hypothetical protein